MKFGSREVVAFHRVQFAVTAHGCQSTVRAIVAPKGSVNTRFRLGRMVRRSPGSRSLRFRRRCHRAFYTTNPIGSLHARLRKIINTRGDFPSNVAS